MCSFAVDSNLVRSRASQTAQAGNAMHAMICGIALLYSFVDVQQRQSTVVNKRLGGLVRRLGADGGSP